MRAICLLLALFSAVRVNANFILWKQVVHRLYSVTDEWHLIQSDDQFYCGRPTRTYGASDVSGDKRGVRCKGNCDVQEHPNKIEELEMHFGNNPKTHWSKQYLELVFERN